MAGARPADPTTAYARGVVSGKFVAGKWVRLACQRHLDDLKTAKTRGLKFDRKEADRAIRFFGILRQSKGEWANQALELQPWQAFIVGSLFGWMQLREGKWLRRYRTAYLSVARKNGKTTLAAGIMLLLAFADGEPGAEVYTAATTKQQARICWLEAKRMVAKSPALRSRIQAFADNLSWESQASKLEPLSADAETKDGLNPHGAAIDEYHAHPNGELSDVIESALGARRQPLIVYTTTAGSDSAGVCAQLDKDVQRILEGSADDDSIFGYIARIDEGDRWDDERVWGKSNPNLGVSVKLHDLQRAAKRAKRMVREQNEFRRKRCNQWTEQATRWLSMEQYDACDVPVDEEALAGAACFSGLDLSTTTDITAFVSVFPDADGGFDVLCRFWIPEDNIDDKGQQDRAPYRQWVDEGYISVTQGNITDYDLVREDVKLFANTYAVTEIPYDKWNATQLATQLSHDGAVMVPMPQGYATLSEPAKYLEGLILSRRIRFGGNPVLRWMAANAAVQTGPNASIRPVKDKSTGRIDGIVALVMALGRAIVHLTLADDTSVYEERGVRRL